MLLNKDLAKRVLDNCLSTGADFAELYVEDKISNRVEVVNGDVNRVTTSEITGVGIRILKELKESYGYSNDLDEESLLRLASNLASSFEGAPLGIEYDLQEVEVKNINPVKISPLSLTNEEKIKKILPLHKAIKSYSEEIIQVIMNLMDETRLITIYNTNGKIINDERAYVRFMGNAVGAANGQMQTMHEDIAGCSGYEVFEGKDLEEMGKSIASSCLTMLHAPEMVGQELPVVIHNGFGGVILHEACVHSLEATSVAKGMSVFCNKMGEKIASDVVTAIDDGTIENEWGSINVDDEGHPSQKNVLIENGVLKSYLFDYRNTRRLPHPTTGSGRRESYKYSPTSRMTNTFIAPGESTVDEIIADTKYGLFAKKMGGGSVNPVTGEFNFAVLEGYMIEDGKITHPVRGATLVGSGKDTLLKIDRVADNLSFGHGVCGSASGSVYTNVGQPTIRVSSMTVGGKGTK